MKGAHSAGQFAALEVRDFRLYWVGQVISVTGMRMLNVAQGWLVYELTGSALYLGAVSLAQAIPATVLTLFGGAVADKVDQRRLMMMIQLTHIAVLAVLAALAFGRVVEPWHVIGSAFLLAAVGSFENPARYSMFAVLVPRELLTSAVAMNSTVHPGTAVFGPIVAGYALAQMVDATGSAMQAGGAVFALAAAGYGIYFFMLQAVRMPPVRRAQGKRMFDDIADGLRLILRERAFAVMIGSTWFIMFCALSQAVLFPVFAKDILQVGPSGLGWLHTAHGLGSLVGAFWAASLVERVGRGRAIVGGCLAVGVMLLGFALSTSFPLSFVLQALASLGGTVAFVAIQSGLHHMVPDEFRGRVMGYWGMTHTCVRPIGEIQLAAVAAFASAPFALALGSGLVILFVLAVILPNRAVRALNRPVEAQSAAPPGGH